MDEILEELVPVMKKEFPRRAPTNENLYSYYNSRVRRHLHVVLCFSPVSLPDKRDILHSLAKCHQNTLLLIAVE